MTANDEAWTHTFPRKDERAARLTFESGVGPRLDVRSAKLDGPLARGRFPDPAPKIEQRGDEIAIDYRGFFRWWFLGRAPPGTLELDEAIPWTIDVSGGVARVDMDLRTLPLSRFEVAGGAAQLDLRLGAPQGIVPVRVAGGAASLRITHPPGAGVRLRVSGGAAQVELDDQSFGAVGGGLTISNREWNEKGDGYDVKIGGGAARLSIVPEGTELTGRTGRLTPPG